MVQRWIRTRLVAQAMIAFDLQPYRVPLGRDPDESARLATWNINGGRFMCSPYIIAEVDRIVADRRSFLKTAA
jgi:hypothetical protein